MAGDYNLPTQRKKATAISDSEGPTARVRRRGSDSEVVLVALSLIMLVEVVYA